MKTTTSCIGLGIVAGAAIGAATDNVSLCVALGVVVGAIISAVKARRRALD